MVLLFDYKIGNENWFPIEMDGVTDFIDHAGVKLIYINTFMTTLGCKPNMNNSILADITFKRLSSTFG